MLALLTDEATRVGNERLADRAQFCPAFAVGLYDHEHGCLAERPVPALWCHKPLGAIRESAGLVYDSRELVVPDERFSEVGVQ